MSRQWKVKKKVKAKVFLNIRLWIIASMRESNIVFPDPNLNKNVINHSLWSSERSKHIYHLHLKDATIHFVLFSS